MKRAVPAFVAAMLFGLSPVAFGGPGKDKPGVKPSQKPPQPEKPEPTPPGSVDDKGYMTSMSVTESGEIAWFNIYIGFTDTNQQLRGCGMKVADHPLLVWAFQSRYAINFTYNPSTKCVIEYDLVAPTSK